MQILKIIKISEGVFKHILVEESGNEHVFFNTKETKLSIDLGTFSISSAGQNRNFTIQNIQVFAIDAVNPTATATLDDLVAVLADLKYPPLLDFLPTSNEGVATVVSNSAGEDLASEASVLSLIDAVKGIGSGMSVMDSDNNLLWMSYDTDTTPPTVTFYEFGTTNITTAVGSVKPYQTTIGTVTANSGTNLNTSLLALEDGNIKSINDKIELINSLIGSISEFPYESEDGYDDGTEISVLKGIYVKLLGIFNKLPVIGKRSSATSISVTIATDDVLLTDTGKIVSATGQKTDSGWDMNSTDPSLISLSKASAINLKKIKDEDFIGISITGKVRDEAMDVVYNYTDGTSQTIYYTTAGDFAGNSTRL